MKHELAKFWKPYGSGEAWVNLKHLSSGQICSENPMYQAKLELTSSTCPEVQVCCQYSRLTWKSVRNIEKKTHSSWQKVFASRRLSCWGTCRMVHWTNVCTSKQPKYFSCNNYLCTSHMVISLNWHIGNQKRITMRTVSMREKLSWRTVSVTDH